MNILKFAQFNSAVDASFWQSLVSKKLNVLKLSDEPQSIRGYYTLGQSATDEQGNRLNIPSPFSIPAEGLNINAPM
jgi:ubiquitin-like modifier-activating enzyme ATG7